jgi:hypothetical protein
MMHPAKQPDVLRAFVIELAGVTLIIGDRREGCPGITRSVRRHNLVTVIGGCVGVGRPSDFITAATPAHSPLRACIRALSPR